MTPLYIIGGIVILLILWVIGTYNKFVTTKMNVEASIQEIGNQLKRQIGLLPNIESLTKGFMDRQETIYKNITDARKNVSESLDSKGDVQAMLNASAKLQQALAPIRVLAESSPEIKGEEATMKAMDIVDDTSDKIMYSTRTVIDLTNSYNIMTVRIPTNIVANIFEFKKLKALEMPESLQQLTVKESESGTYQMKI